MQSKKQSPMEAMYEYIAKTSGVQDKTPLPKKNILLCNTSIELSKMLDTSLSNAANQGYNYEIGLVDITQFGREALKLLKTRSFELLIIDFNLEGSMGCVETIKEIRKQKIRTKIMVTTNVMSGAVKSLWMNGLIDGTLLIPYQDEHLYKAVAEIMSKDFEEEYIFLN